MGQEHLLNASMERLLMVLIDLYQKIAAARALCSARYVASVTRWEVCSRSSWPSAHRIRCCYLGPDLPPMELAKAVARRKAAWRWA